MTKMRIKASKMKIYSVKILYYCVFSVNNKFEPKNIYKGWESPDVNEEKV